MAVIVNNLMDSFLSARRGIRKRIPSGPANFPLGRLASRYTARLFPLPFYNPFRNPELYSSRAQERSRLNKNRHSSGKRLEVAARLELFG